ncbi:MAG TPA: 3' terminal RNA ribose 2'-O-methyltransferase Hen1 [Actinocrinis sp.]|nr:3' terminal RNA ribose 2'-O-methyltransferase Hen1 [Actinocrinis sp.]
MLVTITLTRPPGALWPATDLGYLLAKNPGKVQEFSHAFGTSQVFYPEAGDERCTAALLLEIDPLELARSKRFDAADFSLAEYVNDRPYAATSMLAGALGSVFRTAIRGASKERAELAATALPLTIALPVLGGGAALITRLFEPLGWTVGLAPVALDPAFPAWGDSRYHSVTLTGTNRLADALSQVYVLLPVLDGGKHYWISEDEVDKLLRSGAQWLPGHPDRELITRRYLGRRASFVRSALARLAESDDMAVEELDNAVAGEDADADEQVDAAQGEVRATEAATIQQAAAAEVAPEASAGAATAVAPGGAAASREAEEVAVERERNKSLAAQRHAAVHAALHDAGARRVLDLGCGGGALLSVLFTDRSITELVGVDVSIRALRYAERKLDLDRQPSGLAKRVTLKQGSLTYVDPSLKGYDAAVLMEVIEHVDPPRLSALEYAVFGAARPHTVIVTTPNAEYNVRYETLDHGHLRHHDHRFEWSRAEFESWAASAAAAYGYQVQFDPIGELDDEVGAPTQMAVFSEQTTAEPGTTGENVKEGEK